jgi:hypothetical protein
LHSSAFLGGHDIGVVWVKEGGCVNELAIDTSAYNSDSYITTFFFVSSHLPSNSFLIWQSGKGVDCSDFHPPLLPPLP